MDIEIKGWESKGLRCPDVDVDLDKNKRLMTLVQMPNGTGKTTTLNLIRQCFYEKIDLDHDITKLRRKDSQNKKGLFILKLSIDNSDVSVKLNFDFENNKLSHQTTGEHCGGLKDGLILPEQLETIIDKQFVDLLFFDLEFANELFEEHAQDASEAIGKLTKSYLIDDVIDDFREHIKTERKKTKQSARDINTSKKNFLENEIKKRENSKKKILEKLAEDRIWFKKNDNKIKSMDKQIEDFLSESNEYAIRIEKARNDENKFYQKYKNYLSEQFTKMKNVPDINENFYNIYKTFYDRLEKLKLPQAEAEQFFNELLHPSNKDCICGTPLDEQLRKNIKEKKKNFLSSSETGVISVIKSKIDKIDVKSRLQLNEIKQNINKFQADWKTAAQATNRYEREAIDKSKLKQVKKELDKLKNIQKEKKDFKAKTELPWKRDDNDENTESLISLDKQITDLNKNLDIVSKTLDLTKKIERIKNILNSAKNEATTQIKKELTEECNKKIKDGLKEDPLYIETIGDYIKLKGQASGSVGQNARIGYIFLISLLERTSFKFPLIVDSPAAGIDSPGRVRTAEFICALKGQYIAFILDVEKMHFVKTLEKGRGDNIIYLTSYRKTKETGLWDEQAKPYCSNFESFTNGVLVNNKQFFETFELAEGFNEE